jgi:hypothetical protein
MLNKYLLSLSVALLLCRTIHLNIKFTVTQAYYLYYDILHPWQRPLKCLWNVNTFDYSVFSIIIYKWLKVSDI